MCIRDSINGLKKNHDKFGVTFHRDTYKVKQNDNYGIKPYDNTENDDVEILWFLPDYSSLWSAEIEKLLPDIDSESVKMALTGYPKKDGTLQSGFPNPTVWRINMSDEEAALMSSYSTWCFETILAEESDFFS